MSTDLLKNPGVDGRSQAHTQVLPLRTRSADVVRESRNTRMCNSGQGEGIHWRKNPSVNRSHARNERDRRTEMQTNIIYQEKGGSSVSCSMVRVELFGSQFPDWPESGNAMTLATKTCCGTLATAKNKYLKRFMKFYPV